MTGALLGDRLSLQADLQPFGSPGNLHTRLCTQLSMRWSLRRSTSFTLTLLLHGDLQPNGDILSTLLCQYSRRLSYFHDSSPSILCPVTLDYGFCKQIFIPLFQWVDGGFLYSTDKSAWRSSRQHSSVTTEVHRNNQWRLMKVESRKPTPTEWWRNPAALLQYSRQH